MDKETLSFVVLGIALLFGLFILASWWKVNTKAGQPGWACILPVYSFYVILKIAGKPGWWLFLFLIPLANIYFYFMMWRGVALNFGKDDGFAVGLFLLPFIFMPILAFGDAAYRPSECPAAGG